MDMKRKANEINLVLSEPDVNLWKLRELALTEGGLVDDNLRKRAWPKLVGLHDFYVETVPPGSSVESSRPPVPNSKPPMPHRPTVPVHATLYDDDSSVCSRTSLDMFDGKYAGRTIPSCSDADQIDRDVARCTWHLLTGSQRVTRLKMENKHRKRVANVLRRKQRRLGKLINLTLLRTYDDCEGDKLCYFQGFHDVASIFLSTLGGGGSSPSSEGSDSVAGIASSMGLDLPSAVLSRLSSTHFRDAMRTNFAQLQTAIRLLLMPLINYFDREVHEFLLDCDMEPFFALSWIITWFSHDIRDTALVTRLFDAFIVSHPLFPLYMTVAMVCHPNNRAEVLAAECDFAIVHSTLAALPKNSSMVGWKFRPSEGGYASGDETDDELNSAPMEVSLLIEHHYSMEGRDDEDSETHSLISSQISVGSKGTKVPFQELIDLALTFMRRIPPRKLIHLTSMYFTEDILKPMLELTPSIEFLNPHPKWGLVLTAPADWVLKQRARRHQREGRGLTRRDRRNRVGSSRSRSCTREGVKEDHNDSSAICEDDIIIKFLQDNKRMLAVIACGFGAGDEDEILGRKRRRVMLGCIATAVVVITGAIMIYSSGERDTSARPHDQKQLQFNNDAGTCRALNALNTPSEIAFHSTLFSESLKTPVVSTGFCEFPQTCDASSRLRGPPKVRVDEESLSSISARKSDTFTEARFLVKSHGSSRAANVPRFTMFTNSEGHHLSRVGTDHHVVVSPLQGESFLDRIMTVLPCPNILRVITTYTDLASDKIPKVIRKIARLFRPIIRRMIKKPVEDGEL